MNTKKTDTTQKFSLLAPNESDSYFCLSPNTQNDLSIDYITDAISSNSSEKEAIKRILLKMPISNDIISYRNSIYSELRDEPELCERLYVIFDTMRFYNSDRQPHIEKGSTIWDMLSRLKSLENYIHSILRIKEIISVHEFKSEGLKKFADQINEIYSNSGFDELSKDISIISEDIRDVKSMTLGVNFNNDFYPEEVGIISLNKFYFYEQSMLKRFMKYHRKDQIADKDLMAFSMEMPDENLSDMLNKFEKKYYGTGKQPSANPLMNNLNGIIERMLPSITSRLKRVLHKYVDVSGRALFTLADELLFYLRFIELEKKLTSIGIPCCCGKSSASDTAIKDFCNVKLAVCKLKGEITDEMVYNDIQFTKDKTVWILTGPNRGGKTILTQGIGLAFLLYQSGVFIPASSAKIRLCNGIYTHFPVEEEQTISLGRLGEEAERFNTICKTASSDSLLLFNESFATTSHTESLYIAEDVLRYLCYKGIRTCFNTHMHELAENAEKYSNSSNDSCKAASVVMESNNGNRSYKISFKKPDGKSYAHDIAYKYGITFEQLCGNT